MIITPLMRHQIEGVNYLIKHDPCALFHIMGSGKSLTALAYAEHLKAHRILITSDKNNTLNTWPDEIARHTDYGVVVRNTIVDLGNLNDSRLVREDHTPIGDVSIYTNPTCYCYNYDYLNGHVKELTSVPWDLWIGDESSEFKDPRTLRSKALAKIVSHIPHKVILNGTPLTERAEDLFGQFHMLDNGECLGSCITKFRQRFMQPAMTGFGWEPRRNTFTDIQRATKERSHWLMDPDIKMPKRSYHTVYVKPTPLQLELDGALKEWFAAAMGKDKIEVQYAASLFIKRTMLAGGVFASTEGGERCVDTNKLPVLLKLIRNNIQYKIVIWHQHIMETQIISSYLRVSGVKHWVYDDVTDAAPLKAFQSVDSGVLLIRNSMCKGLNQLADADMAIIYSNPLAYRTRSQLEGRTRRMTSTTEVTHYVDIVTKGMADENVYALITEKKTLSLTVTGLREMIDNKQ